VSDELDPQWHKISRFLPEKADIDTLLQLLKHKDWAVRWNAARAVQCEPDARALKELLRMFKREKNAAVRHMVALALGALHESGVDVPLFTDLKDPTEETRRNLAIKRLKELKVKVAGETDEHISLLIPHNLDAECYIEIGILIAQLTAFSFPEDYAPIADSVPSAVLPQWPRSAIEYPDSYPHGMKFRIYHQPSDE
jgi:hypothetical protein